MTTFQIILVAAFGGLLGLTVLGMLKGWASRGVLIGWIVVWLVGLLAAIWPDVTTDVAQAMGIERGADLLLYCTTVVMLVGFFLLYSRLRRVRRGLTVLTRQIAMLDPHERGPGSSGSSPAQ
ncbi:MAG: DUF2304 domain-containing protein [Phycisphaerales bacterium]|nr:DUF2304 domain-containing protein [Phycisphaerales bacterium]